MPPLVLPAQHFAAALVWLALGAAGLIIIAPDLARGAFLTPRVIAVTHCFTLGWITTSIFGALYQLYPVALGVPARSIRVAHVTFWALLSGTALLVVGSWLWSPAALAAGWLVMFGAVGGQSWNVVAGRRRATRGKTIGLYVSAGHMGLGLAMFVVAVRIGAAFDWWSVDRLGVLSAHAHLAVVGFATLTVVGVGSKLFPMFLLSRGYPEWPLRWIGPLIFGGLVLFTPGELMHVRWLVVGGGGAMALGVVLYLALVSRYVRTKTKATLEPALAHGILALAFLAVALMLGVTVLLRPWSARVITAYAAAGILGWLSILIVGMYYKIVPFLTWLHWFSPKVGQPGLPKVADLVWTRAIWATLALLGAGIATLLMGVLLGSGNAATAGAAAYAAGVGLVVAQYVRLAAHRPAQP